MNGERETLERIREAFVHASIPPPEALEPETRFEAIDGVDSVSWVRLIMSVEQIFGIELSTREASRMQQIGDLTDLIAGKQVSRGS
jgi:acyl carrier protein